MASTRNTPSWVVDQCGCGAFHLEDCDASERLQAILELRVTGDWLTRRLLDWKHDEDLERDEIIHPPYEEEFPQVPTCRVFSGVAAGVVSGDVYRLNLAELPVGVHEYGARR